MLITNNKYNIKYNNECIITTNNRMITCTEFYTNKNEKLIGENRRGYYINNGFYKGQSGSTTLDSFIYLASKLKACIYKITGRRRSCITNFSRSLGFC